MNQESLPTRLRVLRAEKGLTLREAARVTGLRSTTLSELERGLSHPRDVTLSRIAKGYGVPVSELIGMSESEPHPKETALPSPPPAEAAVSEEERRYTDLYTSMFRSHALSLEGELRLLENNELSPEAADRHTEYLRNTIIGQLTKFVISGYPKSAEEWVKAIDKKLDELDAHTERLYREAEEKELDQSRRDELRLRREKHAEREQATKLQNLPGTSAG